MAELDNKMLASVQKALKKLSGNDPEASVSETKVAAEAGVPMGMVGKLIWASEPVVWPQLKVANTDAAVANARDKQGLRWERIAARAGITVSQAKEMYQRKTGNDPNKTYTGRGRRFDGSSSATKPAGSGGKRGAATNGKGTSGRRAAASKDKAAPAAGTGKRGGARTRAERAGASPS